MHPHDPVAAYVDPRERRQTIKAMAGRAMVALRDLEDYARLDLADDVLADRVRGIHEALTEDVLNGSTHRLSASWRARLWDRYCLMRGHDPHAGARARFSTLRAVRYGR